MVNIRGPSAEEFWGLGVGLLVSVVRNRGRGLPVGSTLLGNAVFAAVGLLAGHGIYKYKEDRVKRREVWIWDYVNKHPEDFPELQPGNAVRFKDKLEPWVPIR